MRHKVFLSFGLLVTLLVAACSQTSSTSEVSSSKTQVSSPTSSATQDAKTSALNNQISEIAAEAKGRVGVYAVLLESRTEDSGLRTEKEASETLLASLNPHDHFPMQSVYKLPISMAVMQAVDAGKIKLTDKVSISQNDMVGRSAHSPIRDQFPKGTSLTVEELLRYALVESDGTASDVLMRLAGGRVAVQMYVTNLPVPDMIVLNTEKELQEDWSAQYRNSTTPFAAVALLRALQERRGLSESSQALLLRFMTQSTTGPKRLKGLLPPGTVVAHKTGTSGTENGITAATNDIGMITLPDGRHLAVAVFVSDSKADEATREAVIAKLAKAVWDSETK